MEGKSLIVSVSSMPPFVDYEVRENSVLLKGALGELWATLEERLQFHSKYVLETYDVGVSNFIENKRDILLRPSIVLSEDLDDFNFLIPVTSIWYELYVKDSFEVVSSKSYIKNLSTSFWVSLIAITLVFIITLYIINKIAFKFFKRKYFDEYFCENTHQFIELGFLANRKFTLLKNWRKTKNLKRYYKLKNETSFGYCFITVVAALTEQGSDFRSTLISLRIFLLSCLLFGMIICNSYSALLISQLTSHETFLPFEELDEIPEKGEEFSVCVRPESHAFLYFTVNDSTDAIQSKWKTSLNKEPCPRDGKINFLEICLPYVAFLETPPLMQEVLTKYKNCQMRKLKGKYFNLNLAVLTLKNFSREENKLFTNELLNYRELGIVTYLKRKWIKSPMKSKKVDHEMQVTYKHIKGVLFTYFISIIFSFLILLTENFFHFGMKKLIRYFNSALGCHIGRHKLF